MKDLIIIKKIKFPEKEHFDNLEKKAIELSQEIKEESLKCDKEDTTYEEYEEKIEEKLKEFQDLISLYSFIKIFDKVIDRKEKQYDVTKIYISTENYEIMKAHDKKIVKLMDSDLTELGVNKEVSNLHFFSGFSCKEELDNQNINFIEGYLREGN